MGAHLIYKSNDRFWLCKPENWQNWRYPLYFQIFQQVFMECHARHSVRWCERYWCVKTLLQSGTCHSFSFIFRKFFSVFFELLSVSKICIPITSIRIRKVERALQKRRSHCDHRGRSDTTKTKELLEPPEAGRGKKQMFTGVFRVRV